MRNNSGKIGVLGEEIVVEYLKSKGYLIIERNYNIDRIGEIDIIAAREGVLRFVEVKTSINTSIFSENHSVQHFNGAKAERIVRTMERYCYFNNVSHKTRCIDLAAVTIIPNTMEAKICYDNNVFVSTI